MLHLFPRPDAWNSVIYLELVWPAKELVLAGQDDTRTWVSSHIKIYQRPPYGLLFALHAYLELMQAILHNTAISISHIITLS